MQRTQTCEEELRGTIQRKMRSMSLSSLNHRRVRQGQGEGRKVVANTSGPGVNAVTTGGTNVSLGSQSQFRGLDVSPMTSRKAVAKDSPRSGRSYSILSRFGSLRLTKKKPYCKLTTNM